MALSTRDKMGEGRACSNLGIVYQLLGEHDAALKLHQAHLNIARQLQDKAGMGRAYGNIGNAYSAMGYYEQVTNLSVVHGFFIYFSRLAPSLLTFSAFTGYKIS